MNTLLQVRTNVFYSKKEKKDKREKDEYIRFNEIVLLVDNANYNQTNAGEIVRERSIKELRFIASKDSLDALIQYLTTYRDIEEKDLK